MSLDVSQSLERARQFLEHIPRAAEVAMSRALNRAVTESRDAAVNAMAERYAIQSSDARDKISLTTATPDKLQVAVTSRSESLALGYFPHSPVVIGTGGPGKPILHAEVLRGQDKAVPGAFVATINGKPRIMFRTGGTSKTGRTQIRSVYTVPFATMLGASSVRDAVEDRAQAVIDARLEHEIDQALKERA